MEWTVFGERLSKELEKKQLSYRQFAEMAGITTTTVFRYAKCERIPRANEIKKTADVLGVTCDYLLGLSDDPHKTSMSYVIAQPEKTQLSQEGTTSDTISRKVVKYKLTALVNEFEEILAHIREREVDDSVCGLCEYDGAYMGQSGDWCNECPGFDKDDCFKLKDKYREEWLSIDG